MNAGFLLDPRLEAGSVPVADWPLSTLRLKDDARFHWLLLVPRRAGLVELTDLDEDAYGQLTAEMLAAVKFVRHIAAQPAMKEFIVEEILPGPSITSDADLIQDFRKRSGTVYHPVSTCRMGPDASRAVVDPRLKVHGIDGLRVIDASIFPENISGNTNAPSIMVGWKGAEMTMADHQH